MINSERNVFLQETEIKPNKYALRVMVFTILGVVFCWFLTELGIFHAGKTEMRIGSIVPLCGLLVLLLAIFVNNSLLEWHGTKWIIFANFAIFTFTVNSLLMFHATILLLFPMFVAMLYRSEKFGAACLACSLGATFFTPIISYLLKCWDIPLLTELIYISSGVRFDPPSAADYVSLESIGEIVLYLVLPRTIMVGACAALMFHVIRLGQKQIDNLILLDKINRRDFLTGLYNQNYYKQILTAKKKYQQVGVIFCDVNGLKKINDEFGHERGDLLLKRCAEALLSVCDNDEVNAFRIGGDEFLLIVEHCDLSAINTKKNAIIAALADINNENIELYDRLNCSMAMGVASGSILKLEELVSEADALMYENKRASRSF